MRRGALAALPVALMLAACGSTALSPSTSPVADTTTQPSAAAASPSPVPSHSPVPKTPTYGVLVDLLTSTSIYITNIVGVDGRPWASLKQTKRTPISSQAGHPVELPYISTSATALYFLNGDFTVMAIRLKDGSQAPVTKLAVSPGMEAAFAVSPDDSRIAVSVLDFNRSPVHVLLYTDNLMGGNRQVIFESDSDYVWPVAWHSGLIVLAHAYGPFIEDTAKAAPGWDNPYGAISYHIVDPATANRVYLLGACTVSGPLSPAGSGCIQGGTIDWQGNVSPPWSTRDWGSVSSAAALSPDGRYIAATSPDDPAKMAIWVPDGRVLTYVDGPGVRDWAGWFDDQHLLTGSYLDAGFQPTVSMPVWGAVGGQIVYPVSVHGFYAARLPTDIV
jgi:hypothetical protein